MKYLITAVILALGALLVWFAVPAHAAGGCGDRELFRAALLKNYNEMPRSMAFGGPYVFEVFRSPQGTFTIIVTPASGGIACIIAAGRGWVDMEPETPGEKS